MRALRRRAGYSNRSGGRVPRLKVNRMGDQRVLCTIGR